MQVIVKKNMYTGQWETFVPDIDGFRIATFYSDTYLEAATKQAMIRSGLIKIERNHDTFEYKKDDKK